MAYTDIDKPEDYFNTKLYTGTGSSNAITGVGFQPDWVWIKCRDDTHNHQVFDVVRGVYKRMRTDTDGAETESSESLKSFDSDGFTLGTQANVNNPSNTFASWNWLGGGTASSNTDGSITSSVSASTTAGFSIVSYTGTGSNATVGHGLGVTPKMIIVKNRTGTTNPWWVYTSTIGAGGQLRLNETNAEGSDGAVIWNSTEPTSSVFSVGTNGGSNGSGNPIIAYCFAEKKGFSKFGSYTGNGSTDGTFVYTGFKPAWVMIKSNTDASEWAMFDNKRNTGNETADVLRANSSSAETDSTGNNSIDILSNGFKVRGTGGWVGTSGRGFIYMCFASNPFVTSTGIPTTAR